jgi:hypothetical protein
MRYVLRLKGGVGSGHHGHKGIPGHQGGSLPRGSNASAYTDARKRVLDSKLLDEASESWFEFYDASVIKDISKGIDVYDANYTDGMGEHYTKAELDKFTKYAQVLQDAAVSSNSGYTILYRGTMLPIEDLSQYGIGNKITFDSLLASSPKFEIANIYAQDPYELGKVVMFKLQNSNGIIGYERDAGNEVILPRGSTYTVKSSKEINGILTIMLSSDEELQL